MTSSELTAQLRATAPRAPEPLRERVLALGTQEVVPRWRLQLTPRRTALALVGALLFAGLGSALVHGLATSGSGGEKSVAKPYLGALPATTTVPQDVQQSATGAQHGTALRAGKEAAPLPPSVTRLQQYEVSLRVRVKDQEELSRSVVRAMRLTRGYGGYVASVDYDTPGVRKGVAQLVLRVPVTKVQSALLRFSDLGSVLSQHVSILDLQAGFNATQRRIGTLRARIAEVNALLRDPSLAPEKRAALQAELAQDKLRLGSLLRSQRSTLREGRLARVYLGLTTEKAAAVAPHRPGRIERTLDDAGSVLAHELAVLLYVLVVAGPLLLLGLAGLLLVRSQRRRSAHRLLARS